MGLGDKSLSSRFMNGQTGNTSSQEEQEYLNMRHSEGDRENVPGLADIYDRTGNMRVSRTLAKYQKGGSIYDDYWDNLGGNKEAAPNLGEKTALAKGDPWEYQMDGDNVMTRKKGDTDWITTDGDVRQSILDKQFPGYGSPNANTANSGFGYENTADPYLPNNIKELEEGRKSRIAESNVEGNDQDSFLDKLSGADVGNGLMNASAGLLNIAPNLSNIKDYKNLKGRSAPNLRRNVNVEAPSFEDEKQSVIAQGRNMANEANSSTQSNTARRALAMSGTQQALSSVGNKERNAKVAARNTNARMAAQTDAANIRTMNEYDKENMERELAKTRGIAGEISAIYNKSLGFIGDIRNQKLDREKMDLTRRRYNFEGQMDREYNAYLLKYGTPPPGYKGYKPPTE